MSGRAGTGSVRSWGDARPPLDHLGREALGHLGIQLTQRQAATCFRPARPEVKRFADRVNRQ
jgi:hypothetical protein